MANLKNLKKTLIFVNIAVDISKITIYNKIAFDLEVLYIMKRTYQPNKKKRAKKHGFFARLKGKVLNKRRAKQRKKLCA